jgi:hypothetical protein
MLGFAVSGGLGRRRHQQILPTGQTISALTVTRRTARVELTRSQLVQERSLLAQGSRSAFDGFWRRPPVHGTGREGALRVDSARTDRRHGQPSNPRSSAAPSWSHALTLRASARLREPGIKIPTRGASIGGNHRVKQSSLQHASSTTLEDYSSDRRSVRLQWGQRLGGARARMARVARADRGQCRLKYERLGERHG